MAPVGSETIAVSDAARRVLARALVAPGGMVPPGADAVVMVEHTDEVGDGTFEVHRGVSPWQHVVRAGEDIAKDAAVFPAGRRLRPAHRGNRQSHQTSRPAQGRESATVLTRRAERRMVRPGHREERSWA